MQKWVQLCENYVSNLEVADAAHDIAHVKRVVVNAIKFAEQEHADLSVVIPAAWLHDCVTVAKNSPQRQQASDLSAQKAEVLLEQWGYPQKHIANIKHAIIAHSYSANVTPQTLEAKVVQDADRIDSIGAIGVARMMMVGGKMDCTLYQHEDPFCEQRDTNDKQWTVDHFYSKLLKLNAGFHTTAAKEEAQRRHDYMLGFLQQLKTEISV